MPVALHDSCRSGRRIEIEALSIPEP